MENVAPSMLGQILHIWYELHVFVKHDCWNDIGPGSYVSFPILIVQKEPDADVSRIMGAANQSSN